MGRPITLGVFLALIAACLAVPESSECAPEDFSEACFPRPQLPSFIDALGTLFSSPNRNRTKGGCDNYLDNCCMPPSDLNPDVDPIAQPASDSECECVPWYQQCSNDPISTVRHEHIYISTRKSIKSTSTQTAGAENRCENHGDVDCQGQVHELDVDPITQPANESGCECMPFDQCTETPENLEVRKKNVCSASLDVCCPLTDVRTPVHLSGCGVAPSESKSSFPWTAFLYKRFSENDKKFFVCGATIISNTLLLTAASRCVYEHSTNTTTNPENLFITAGEAARNYDHHYQDLEMTWQRTVKNVFIHCDYHGKSGADIAFVRIHEPFEFSSILGPACVNLGEQILEPGVEVRIAEFGKAEMNFRLRDRNSTTIKTVLYVPYDECKTSDKISDKAGLTSDKFCASYPDRSTDCVYDYGSGLMFKRNNLWYIEGIVNTVREVSFPIRTRTCDDYVICTDISQYIGWIDDVVLKVERDGSHPICDGDRSQVVNAVAVSTTVNYATDRVLPNIADSICLAPSQPKNGEWQLYAYPCGISTNCMIPEGTELQPGSHLIYNCAPGHKASGSTHVYCESSGNWSIIPVCTEIKCDSLNSVSTIATCTNPSGKYVSCDPAVSPGTQAEVSCHLGYRPESSFETFGGTSVKCNENGKWAPAVIRCVPVCGIPITHQTALIWNGVRAKTSDFPWHATLYVQKNASEGAKKNFICGATIIHSSFLLTAAHCVYDEGKRATEDPKKFFVMTGNVFRDYDSALNNPETVIKSAVKNIYRPCRYYGIRGNYALDIALIELQQPYEFSRILSPACLDVQGFAQQTLEPGALGKVAGFGRTESGESSAILQTLTLPYVSYSDCMTPNNTDEGWVFISDDKFCAGYTSGSAVCEGDSGGGLVFRKSELWYVLGIVSVGLGVDIESGERTCDRYSYSLYTKVSKHMTWIQDVISKWARQEPYPSCDTAV